MIEPSYEDFRQNFAVAGPNRLRSIFPILVAVVAIAVGGAVFWQFYRGGFSGAVTPRQDAAAEFAPLMKEADASQQQAAEQVQALQQDLAAQQAQTRRLADEIDALTSKVDALQQSFTSAQTTVGRAPAPKRRPLPPPTAPLSIRP